MVSEAEPQGPASRIGSAHGPASLTCAPPGRAPTFTLFEPNPAFARMYAEGETIPVPARQFGPPNPTCHPARLLARLEALQAAIENREALALHHARSIPRKIAKDCFARVNPWRVGAAPGIRSRHTEPWLTDMLALFMMAIRHIPPPERPRPAL